MRWAVTVIAAGMLILGNGAALAVDWSSCHSDLDRLRRASRDAADAADQAGSEYRDLESAASDAESKANDLRSAISWLRSCQGSGGRDCSSERWRYESARSDYESAKSRFESAKSDYESAKSTADSHIDTVASRVRSAESSCDTTLSGTAGTGPRGSRDPGCRVLQRYKGKLTASRLMELCLRSKSEAECKECLDGGTR
jgi:hypothetical protein